MKTRKLLAVVLSVLMIISVMPTTIFAVPSAVTVGDSAHEHEHEHEAQDASLAFDGQWVTIVTEVKYGTSADSLTAGANLDYAWAEADKGGYYQLRKNASISATLEMPELERTLDLNGFTLTVEGNIPAFAVNTGTLTIVDSSVTKTGKIVSTGSVIEVGNGTVVLTGGTFEGSKAIDITSESLTYADLLGENCFYTNGEDDAMITDEATLASAAKLKVVKKQEKITVTMTDSFGDSWNGAAIEVYKGTTLVDTITVDSDTNTYTLLYDDMSEYIFKWKKGSYDNECSFTIAIGEDALKTVDNADVFADGETIYTIESKCEHDVSQPCGACSVCSMVCGTDFAHKFDENNKCSVCSFECGVTAEHDWSNKDGICKVCGYECPEHSFDENYVCTICTYSYKALIISEDGTSSTAYEFINEALEAAQSLENSTVKLLDNITTTDYYTINSGKFTIDLNGKIWQSSDVLLYINGTSQIKICDSSEYAGGLMTTSGDVLIFLMDETKLEIESGNFACTGNVIFDMSNSGMETSSELLISDGRFVCNGAVSVAGRKVTLTGGEFECAWGYPFNYLYGTLDLSNYIGTSEMGFYVSGHIDASALELILPAGAIIRNYFTDEIVTELVAGDTYRIEITEISSIEINLGEKADETNIRYAEIDGVVSAVEENDNKYSVDIGDENLLIEFVEKTADGKFVKSQYFYVDMVNKTATKLDMDSYMQAYDETSIRTKDPQGLRFKSHVVKSAKTETVDFVIDEYGFVIARADHLGDTELTLGFETIATGVAYNRLDETDIVFDASSDSFDVFTGVLKNIPVKHYKTDVVCKTYTKITVDGKQFTVYGEAVVGNLYDTAKELLVEYPDNAEYQAIVAAYDNEIRVPVDDIFPES